MDSFKSAFIFVLLYFSYHKVEAYGHALLSCKNHFKAGHIKNGYYLIEKQNPRQISTVYCDFNSEPGMAWTLAMSYSFVNVLQMPGYPLRTKPLTTDFPVNNGHPNWFAYRMSKAAMSNLAGHSTHFRYTCNFKNFIKSRDFKDYLRGKLASVSPLTYVGVGNCRQVEYINIRDHSCANCRVPFWQLSNMVFHTDSSNESCDLKPSQGATSSEDNFGFYHKGNANKKFSCTASLRSTTQLWFGIKI